MRKSYVLACLVLLATVAPAACARECAPRVRDGWIRLMPGGAPVQAGFGRIGNDCPSPATIVSATSPAYGSVELHGSSRESGISRMRAVPLLRIPPGATAVFEPGGLHLMLVRPRSRLRPGDRVAIGFMLQDGRRLSGEFEVRGPMD